MSVFVGMSLGRGTGASLTSAALEQAHAFADACPQTCNSGVRSESCPLGYKCPAIDPACRHDLLAGDILGGQENTKCYMPSSRRVRSDAVRYH